MYLLPVEDDVLRSRVRLGIVITYNAHNYPYVQVDVVQGEPNEENTGFIGKIEKLDVARFVSTEILEKKTVSYCNRYEKF